MADLSNNPITQVTTTANDAYGAGAAQRTRRGGRLRRWLEQWVWCVRPMREDTAAQPPRQAAPMTVYEKPLLSPPSEKHRHRKCLVLDLDETLVHSSFKPVKNADFVIPVEIDGHIHNVYVLKRPHVDEFMKRMGELYEIVVFTASLSKYADPVLDNLDIHRVVNHRLFRESCHFHKGNYVKDLNRLGRDLRGVLIIDNAPVSYLFNPENALAISTWIDDPSDRELLDLIPFLEDLTKSPDVAETLSKLAAGLILT